MNWKETYTKIFLKQANIGISEASLKEYMPVCAGGEQYNNFCLATCAGYDEDEISVIEIPQEEIDRGILISVDCSI